MYLIKHDGEVVRLVGSVSPGELSEFAVRMSQCKHFFYFSKLCNVEKLAVGFE